MTVMISNGSMHWHTMDVLEWVFQTNCLFQTEMKRDCCYLTTQVLFLLFG